MAKHELLNNIKHQNTKVLPKFGAEYGDDIASVLVFPNEIIELQKEYAITFRKTENGDYCTVVLLGLEKNENLFLQSDSPSGWNAHYIPAIVEKGPFLIGFQQSQQSQLEENAQPVIHIDVEHPKVSESEGQPLFLEFGGNSKYLEYISGKLQLIHQGMSIEKQMFKTLLELDLLEPCSIEFPLKNGEQCRLTGNHTINQDKLNALSDEALGQLHRAGILPICYAVIASLSNINRLIDAKNQKLANA